jgi:hypothetical protein
MVLAAAFVIVFDAAVMAAPHTLAEPTPSAAPSIIAVASSNPTVVTVASLTPHPPGAASWPTVVYATDPPTPTPRPTPKPRPTPAPTMRDTVWNARTYVKNRVGARGYDCINAIWTVESKWNPRAGDPAGAYGIPQANPGSKMAAFGSNWRYSPLTQVKWGLWYIASRYGSACAAYNFWAAHGWY